MIVSDRLRPSVDLLTEKYEVLEELAGGGMGHVFRARHRQLRSLVAIKLLQQDITGSDAVTRFLREARAVARIGSPHVARVMDAGVLGTGQPYIVMEYLHGRDLARQVSAEGRLPVERAVEFILQALEAIAEAHAHQIVHRDIKPANLFATRMAGGDTLIKVLDFGLAKASLSLDTQDTALTERGAVLGTPSYMSPEQFVDAPTVDVRSDIWALGATLFELLTGVAPFTGTSLPQVYRAVMHRPIPTLRSLVPELPEELENIVATCLTRERELRYADVAELAVALKPWGGPSASAYADRVQRILAQRQEPADDDAAGLGEISRAPREPSSQSYVAAITGRFKQPRARRISAASAVMLALSTWLVISSTSAPQKVREDESTGSRAMLQIAQSANSPKAAEPAAPSLAPDAAVELSAEPEPKPAPVVPSAVESAAPAMPRPAAGKRRQRTAAAHAPERSVYEIYP